MKPFVMKRYRLALTGALAAAALTAPAAAQEAAGSWLGVLEPTPGARLPLILQIRRDDGGALVGIMQSPLQGIQELPLAQVAVEAGSLTFTAPALNGSYKGQWDPQAKTWKGEWSQAGRRWPLSFAVPPPIPPPPADWRPPPDSEIARLIAARNAPRPGQGIVVGVLAPEGRRFVAGGTGAGAKVDSSTLFEIGSISKVFTALILADMASKGEVSLDDPAAKYLPAGHHMPERGGRPITLRDLSTHSSGLPRMADDMGPVDDPDGPFLDYGEAKLLAFLDRYQLTRDVGSKWEYSNLGVGLLGDLLARAAHTDYETLLRQRITGPLGMKDTLIKLPRGKAGRLAPPFDVYMRPARPWSLGLFAGAGGIRSSAADMLIFSKAVLDPTSPIAAAVKTALSVRVPGEAANVDQALGWEVLHPSPDREVVLHNGQTGGYRAALAIEPAKGRAVVALANAAADPEPMDIAVHILMGTPVAPTPPVPPAPPPRSKHVEIPLPTAALDKFAGRYDFGPGVVIVVTRQGGGLFAQREGIPGAPALQIVPEGPLAFFWKAVDAQIRFDTDASGVVAGAEFTQGGARLTGKRAP